MKYRRYVSRCVQVLFVGIIAALILGQAVGHPILLSYVETESMAPTIPTGDGFVAIPTGLTGEISEGDVVVFHAEEIQGGGLVTHRVVAETDRGYVTRGDANPFTDQDSGEPLVQDTQIVATAWQVNGHVVVLPKLGTIIQAMQGVIERIQLELAKVFDTRAFLGTVGIAYLLFGISVLTYIVDRVVTAQTGSKKKDRDRSRGRRSGISTRLIVVVLAVVVMAAATAAMVVPAGTQEYGIVSAEFESENPTVIPQGSTGTLPYVVSNAGVVPIHSYIEPASKGVDVDPNSVYVGSRSDTEVTVSIKAPDQTGFYRLGVTEYRYLAVLPTSAMNGLYSIHPWVPILVINALLGGGVYVIGMGILGSGRTRLRRRNRRTSTDRIQRLKEGLY